MLPVLAALPSQSLAGVASLPTALLPQGSVLSLALGALVLAALQGSAVAVLAALQGSGVVVEVAGGVSVVGYSCGVSLGAGGIRPIAVLSE